MSTPGRLAQLRPYLPAIAMTLVAVLQVLQTVVSDGLTLVEAGTLAVAIGGAATTYLVPSLANVAPWAKTVVAAYSAGAVVVADALAAGALDVSVLIAAVVAVLLTVYGEPAARHQYALAA